MDRRCGGVCEKWATNRHSRWQITVRNAFMTLLGVLVYHVDLKRCLVRSVQEVVQRMES